MPTSEETTRKPTQINFTDWKKKGYVEVGPTTDMSGWYIDDGKLKRTPEYRATTEPTPHQTIGARKAGSEIPEYEPPSRLWGTAPTPATEDRQQYYDSGLKQTSYGPSKVDLPPSFTDELQINGRLYYNPVTNTVGTDETKFPLYIDSDNSYSLSPTKTPAFADFAEMVAGKKKMEDSIPARSTTGSKPETGGAAMNLLGAVGKVAYQFYKTFAGDSTTQKEFESPIKGAADLGSAISNYSPDVTKIPGVGFLSKVAPGFSKFVFDILHPLGGGQAESQNFVVVNQLTGETEVISVGADRLFSTDKEKADVMTQFSYKWWELFTAPISDFVTRLDTGSGGLTRLGLQAFSFAYDFARFGAVTTWDYTIGSIYKKDPPLKALISRTLDKYAELSAGDNWDKYSTSEKIRAYTAVPLSFLLQERDDSDRLMYKKMMGSVHYLEQAVNDVVERAREIEEFRESENVSIDSWESKYIGARYEEIENAQFALEQETWYAEGMRDDLPQSERIAALEKAVRAYMQRTDQVQDMAAGTWLMSWDADEREAAFINGYAQAMLQKGGWLSKKETWMLMQRYVDPGTEFAYEYGFDLTNFIPAGFISDAIKPLKKLVGKGTGLFGTAMKNVDPTLYKITKDFFVSNSYKAAATKMKSKFSRAVMDMSSLVSNDTYRLAEMLRTVGRLIRNQEVDRIAKLGLSDRFSRILTLLDRGFVDAGKSGEFWGSVVENVVNNVRMNKADFFKNTLGKNADEAARMAEEFVSKANNITPYIADEFEHIYLRGKQAWQGGPLEKSVTAGIGGQLQKLGVRDTVIKEGLNTVSRFMGAINSTWMKLVLTARPGFTVVNYIDSIFRALLNGARPFQSYDSVLRVLDDEILEAFMTRDIFGGTSIGRMAKEGYKPKSLAGVFIEGVRASQSEGWKGLGGVLQLPTKYFDHALDGVAAMNSWMEFTWRARVFSTQYTQNMRILQEIATPVLENIFRRAVNESGAFVDEATPIRELVMNVWKTTKNPAEMRKLIGELLTGEFDEVPSFIFIPQGIRNRAHELLPPSVADEFLSEVSSKIVTAMREAGEGNFPTSGLIHNAMNDVMADLDLQINDMLAKYEQLSMGDEILNGMPAPVENADDVIQELRNMVIQSGSSEENARLLDAFYYDGQPAHYVPDSTKPMYAELMGRIYSDLPNELQLPFLDIYSKEFWPRIQPDPDHSLTADTLDTGAEYLQDWLIDNWKLRYNNVMPIDEMGTSIGYTYNGVYTEVNIEDIRQAIHQVYAFGYQPRQELTPIMMLVQHQLLKDMGVGEYHNYYNKKFMAIDVQEAYFQMIGKTMSQDDIWKLVNYNDSFSTIHNFAQVHGYPKLFTGFHSGFPFGEGLYAHAKSILDGDALATFRRYIDEGVGLPWDGPNNVLSFDVHNEATIHRQIIDWAMQGKPVDEINYGAATQDVKELYTFWLYNMAEDFINSLEKEVLDAYSKTLTKKVAQATKDTIKYAGATDLHKLAILEVGYAEMFHGNSALNPYGDDLRKFVTSIVSGEDDTYDTALDFFLKRQDRLIWEEAGEVAGFDIFKNNSIHEQAISAIMRGKADTQIDEVNELVAWWTWSLVDEFSLRAEQIVADIPKEFVDEAIDGGVEVLKKIDLTEDVLQALVQGKFVEAIDELPKLKLLNMPEPIRNLVTPKLEEAAEFGVEDLNNLADIINAKYIEAGGNPSNVYSSGQIQTAVQHILDGTEMKSASTGSEFLLYSIIRKHFLEEAGLDMGDLDDIVEWFANAKLAAHLEGNNWDTILDDYNKYVDSKWTIDLPDISKITDPKNITKKQHAREAGAQMAQAHRVISEMIRDLWKGTPAEFKANIGVVGIPGLEELRYLSLVEDNMNYIMQGPLKGWLLEYGPAPLKKTGKAKVYAWNDYFDMQGKLYETVRDEFIRVVSMTPEERIIAAQTNDFMSVYDLLKKSGIHLRFDESGTLFEIRYGQSGLKTRYSATLNEFERMFGMTGEDAFKAPFNQAAQSNETLVDQIARAMSFEDITFQSGQLPKLNEKFGVPDGAYNEGMPPGSKRYIVKMPDGSTKTMGTTEVAMHYLDPDELHWTYFKSHQAPTNVVYWEEHPLEYNLRKWLGTASYEYKKEFASLIENTDRGKEIQEFTTWLLYHEHGDTVNLWNGMIEMGRSTNEKGKIVRPWDSMTYSESVMNDFHPQGDALLFEIPVENVAISFESFPAISRVYEHEQEIILNAKGVTGGRLLQKNGAPPTPEDLIHYGVQGGKAPPKPSSIAGDIQSKWQSIIDIPIIEMDGLTLKQLYPNQESPTDLIKYLDNKVRVAKEEGRQKIAEIYEYRTAQVEHLWNQILKSEGFDPLPVKYIPTPPSGIPTNRQNYFRNAEVALRQLENSRQLMGEWTEQLIRMIDENSSFYPQLGQAELGVLENFGNEAAIIRQQMQELAVYGSNIGADVQDFVVRGIPEDFLDNMVTNIEENIHPAFKNLDMNGALHKTNRSMLDYNRYTSFDELMMIPFPFWKFPSRSLPFWMETLITKPQLTSFYMKYLRMSERYAYQAGATTTYGEQLPSLRGYVPIPGTDNLWFNPTAPLSFRYAIPEENRYMDDALSGESPLMMKMTNYLYSFGSMFGLNPSPWMSLMMYSTGILDEKEFPRWSLIPQTSFVPPFAHRWIEEAIRKRSFPFLESTYTKLFNPDVSWEDYMIERRLLANGLEILEGTSMTEAEKVQYFKTMVLAVNFSTNVRVETAEGVARKMVDINNDGNFISEESLTSQQRQMLAEAEEMWKRTRNELEDSEYWRGVVGYFTGIYAKEFTTAEADLLETRDQINALKWSITSAMGWDVNSEEIARLFGEYAYDAEELRKRYTDARYDSWAGKVSGLYGTLGWIDIPHVPPGGGQWTLKEYQEIRKQILAERISQELTDTAYFDAVGVLWQATQAQLAQVPIGDTLTRSKIWSSYFESRMALDTNPLYAGTSKSWVLGYRKQEQIEDHFRDYMFQMIKETKPVYDREIYESYSEYQADYQRWLAEIPELSKPMVRMFQSELMQYFGTEMQGQDLPAIYNQILTELTGDGYLAWEKSNDSPLDAANEAWKVLYMDEYFNAIEGKSGTAFEIAQAEFLQKHPGPPNTDELIAWILQNYPGQFTSDQLKVAIEGVQVFDVDDKFYDPENPFSNDEDRVWELLSWIPSGSAYGDFIDEYVKNGGKESDLDIWYAVGGMAGAYKDPEKFKEFLKTIEKTINSMGIEQPKIEDMQDWLEAETLNDRFKKQVTSELGSSFYDEMSYYFSLSSREKKEYREQNPTISDRIDEYYDMKDEYGQIHQIWAQFYHRDAWLGSPDAGTGGSSYYGGGGGYYKSGKSGRKRKGGSSAGIRAGNTVDSSLFVGVGGRSVTVPEYLIKPGAIGKAKPAGRPNWPVDFVQDAGPILVDQVKKMEDGIIKKMSEPAEDIASSLIKAAPEKYGKFLTVYLQPSLQKNPTNAV